MTSVPHWQPGDEPQWRPSRDRRPEQEFAPARQPTPSGEAELGTDGPGAIVVGVDGTPTSLRALAYAAGLARRQHARLIAVYVRKPLRTPVALSGWVDAGIVAAEAEAQKDMEDEVWTQIAADVAAWGCGARVVIRNGSPLAELRKVAIQAGADSIIVGASRGLAHKLFGSLGHRLLRCKPCPVTIVP
ncbi:MAG: universal stress protein [Actinobacteria bacterium]|nr:universal stress protein [Actinomycetota bacterium]